MNGDEWSDGVMILVYLVALVCLGPAIYTFAVVLDLLSVTATYGAVVGLIMVGPVIAGAIVAGLVVLIGPALVVGMLTDRILDRQN